jgi:predicted dehydrogenase
VKINRILIVGLGSIGKRHLRLLRSILPEAQIGVLRHKTINQVPEFANFVFSRMDEALAFAPQIAVISNPASLHIDSAIPLVQAGVHLLIEKPLSTSVAGVLNLLEECKRNNVILAVGYNLRFSPSLLKFKSLIDDGIIGRIWSVRSEAGQYLPSWRPESDYRYSVSAQSSMGGGVLLELSHELDYLRWIFGDVDWVQAMLFKQSDLEVDVEDSAHILMGFIPQKMGEKIVATVDLDFIRQDAVRTCNAIGEFGSLTWNGLDGSVKLWKINAADWQELYRHQPNRDQMYMSELDDFISNVRSNTQPRVTGNDGLKVLQIVDAVRYSSDSNASRTQVAS